MNKIRTKIGPLVIISCHSEFPLLFHSPTCVIAVQITACENKDEVPLCAICISSAPLCLNHSRHQLNGFKNNILCANQKIKNKKVEMQ